MSAVVLSEGPDRLPNLSSTGITGLLESSDALQARLLPWAALIPNAEAPVRFPLLRAQARAQPQTQALVSVTMNAIAYGQSPMLGGEMMVEAETPAVQRPAVKTQAGAQV